MENNFYLSKEKKFQFFFQSYYATLCSYCERYIPNKQVCEDIVQDIFIILWQKEIKIDNDDAMIYYLKACARNSCLNYIKRKNLEKKYIEEALIKGSEEDKLYSIEELHKKLKEILVKIPEKYREVYIMCFMEGKKNIEIAEIINISTKTVERYKKKCFEILQEELKDYNFIFLLMIYIQLNNSILYA